MAMVLTILPISLSAAADTEDGYGRNILAQMANAEALLYVYDVIEEAVAGTPASIPLSHNTYKVTWDEACTVYDLVLSDHPEIFWHGTSYSGSLRGDYAAAIRPTYVMTGSALTAAKAALENEVVRLTADLEGKSDYEKSLILHDRVAAETLYTMQGEHQTAYGALVQGTAVCAGYARAYQLLMQRVGIPTWYVTGTSVSPSGKTVGHAWNLVQLDGQWYYTDVTWDDQTNYTFYAYLNNTTAQITEDHTFGAYADYLPTATATANNYFVRNNRQMATLNVAAVADIIRTDSPARVYVTGNKQTFIDHYSLYLYDICDALNAPAGSISYGHSTLGREVILRLNVAHTCRYVAHSVAPTCSTDGYSAEICSYEFCHNERNRTVLPATGNHVYDHGCDDTCNTCGAHRAVSDHVYANACDADCNVCGFRREASVHVYDTPCAAACRECGAIRTVTHDYVVQVITPATCGTVGLQSHTCSLCGDTYNETIPATGEHHYENACATMCMTCGTVREVEGHVYDYPCSTFCRECGALRQDEAVHNHVETVITPATCGKEGLSRFTCTYCGNGFTMITPMTRLHVYDNDCDSECNVCYTMRWVPGHTYDHDCDDTCNTCDHVREVGDHVYDGACDPDCNVCGAVREDVVHVYDNDCDADCNACGFTRTAPHVYDDDKDAACNACGAVRPLYKPGDVTNDGKINVRDLGILQQFLNGWDVTLVREAADVTGDGKVNVRDLGILQQFLNGWDVVLK